MSVIISGLGHYRLALLLTIIPTILCINHFVLQIKERSNFKPSEFENIYDMSNIKSAIRCLLLAFCVNLIAIYFCFNQIF